MAGEFFILLLSALHSHAGLLRLLGLGSGWFGSVWRYVADGSLLSASDIGPLPRIIMRGNEIKIQMSRDHSVLGRADC